MARNGKGSSTGDLPDLLPIGRPFTYPNGLRVCVSELGPHKPSNDADRPRAGEVLVRLTVTVTNHAREKLELDCVTLNVRSGPTGRNSREVYDFEKLGEGLHGKLWPGRSASATYAFALPNGTADQVDIEVEPDAGNEVLPSATWTNGPISAAVTDPSETEAETEQTAPVSAAPASPAPRTHVEPRAPRHHDNGAVPFGTAYTFADALQVLVSAPLPYEAPQSPERSAVPEDTICFTVTVHNGTAGKEDVRLTTAHVRAGVDGFPCEEVRTSDHRCAPLRGSVLPGRRVSFLKVVRIPLAVRELIDVEVQIGRGEREEVTWSGSMPESGTTSLHAQTPDGRPTLPELDLPTRRTLRHVCMRVIEDKGQVGDAEFVALARATAPETCSPAPFTEAVRLSVDDLVDAGLVVHRDGTSEVAAWPATAPEAEEEELSLGRRVVASSVYMNQLIHIRRAPAPAVVAHVIDSLIAGGCRLPAQALATAVVQAGGRALHNVDGFIATLRRLLNVEAYPVLDVIDPSGTVQLDAALLAAQFGLDHATDGPPLV